MKNHRKESLEKLTSPEQLDRLLKIIRTPSWVALVCLLVIILAIFFWAIFGNLPITTEGQGIFFNPQSIELIQSESEGVVEQVYVAMGDYVKKGNPLLKIKTLNKKEEQLVHAPADGRVLMVEVIRGETFRFGKNFLWFQEMQESEQDVVYGFFPIEKGDQIKPGMKAHILFDAVRAEVYGKMEGVVSKILPFAASAQGAILKSVPSAALREYLTKAEAPVVIIIQPIKDPTTSSGYRWTTSNGPPYQILPGSVAKVEIFLEKMHPISYVIPEGN